ncbi:CPX1 [Symbiodinium natans]|uniref:CPX1 protein n=1 Tax=Symbiodinium natans TaxID=878477 RepID=A0A812JHF4_9DINO|nr:CPX1 [Symbiodinium natans]
MRSGPDIVALPDEGRYELLLDSQNRVVGIRVMMGDVLCWQLSGAVLFVAASGDDEEAAYVQQVNISVQQEEAMPVLFTPFGGLAYFAGILAYLFFFCMSCGLVRTGELSVQAEDVDVWWYVLRSLIIGGQVWAQLLVDTLLGRQQPLHAATGAILFGAVVWTLADFFVILSFEHGAHIISSTKHFASSYLVWHSWPAASLWLAVVTHGSLVLEQAAGQAGHKMP